MRKFGLKKFIFLFLLLALLALSGCDNNGDKSGNGGSNQCQELLGNLTTIKNL